MTESNRSAKGAAKKPASRPRPRAGKPDAESADKSGGQSASQLISKKNAELGDWRWETLSRTLGIGEGKHVTSKIGE